MRILLGVLIGLLLRLNKQRHDFAYLCESSRFTLQLEPEMLKSSSINILEVIDLVDS